jgi:hypothetical protein
MIRSIIASQSKERRKRPEEAQSSSQLHKMILNRMGKEN